MRAPPAAAVRERLLAWFRASRRDLPWRRTRDPYRILVAECLLQRTRVVSGTPYYEAFLRRFPTVRALASAPEDDVLRAWEGLGFYGRARNLHAAAKAVVERHGGAVPRDVDALRALPGLGPYTAGAVASIAFDVPVPAVDGNASRVLARLFRVEDDVSRGPGRRRIDAAAAALVPSDRPGEFNQALMELGATVCTSGAPRCGACPLESLCVARAAGIERTLPRRPAPRRAPEVPVVFALVESRGRVLLVRRPSGGLLGGLWSLPGGERPPDADDREALRRIVREQAGVRVRAGPSWARVGHAFSHRRWTGTVYRCSADGPAAAGPGARWATRDELASLPMVPFHRDALEEWRPPRDEATGAREP